jgi:hypothetical protein
MTILLDTHEPPEMMRLLSQAATVVREDLNINGYADVMWSDAVGAIRHWETEQISTLLADLDLMEEKLNKYKHEGDELTLGVIGVPFPTAGGVETYEVFHNPATSRPTFKKTYTHGRKGLYSLWEHWKWSVSHDGIEIVERPNMVLLVQAIVAAYQQSMKKEHQTLHRYVRVHQPSFQGSIHVDNLIRMRSVRPPGIGVVRAQALIKRFKTLYGVMAATQADLAAVIGQAGAETFMETVGRTE